MRIALDASWAAATGTGTASYTNGLINALLGFSDHEYLLYFKTGDDVNNPLYGRCEANVQRQILPGRTQPERTFKSLSMALHRDRPDVFHSPGFFLPLWRGPKVVTFHDVNMILHRDKWWRPGMRKSWLSLTAQTLLASRLAQSIVTDSYESQKNIRQVLRVGEGKVRVLYPGVDDRYFMPVRYQDSVRVLQLYGLDRYLLYVSVLSPQKNLEGVVRSFALLGRDDLQLALVGREDGRYHAEVIEPLIHRLGIANRVCRLGVVPVEALPSLYAAAEVFVYPSFGEGFGLPPLEAMASGTPVVASNVASLPEVLGNAALLIDPHDVQELTAAITRVLRDGDVRAGLVARGHERARTFRWSETARKVLEIYAEVA